MLMPVGKRLIVKGLDVAYGSIIVSGQKPLQFLVLEIGDEVTKAKKDDVVYLDRHHGVEIEHEKEKYIVIDETSILAKLTK